MNRAEIEALKAYPKEGEDKTIWTATFGEIEIDKCAIERKAFKEGYEQAEKDLADIAALSSGPDGFYYGRGYQQGKKDAEKDLALTLEDIELLHRLFAEEEDNFSKHDKYFYTEVLDRFNKSKEK